MVISWWIVLMMNYDITEREKGRLGTEIFNSRSLPLNTFPWQIVLLSLSSIAIHHQNYHDITNFMNLTFTLYKILKACIISVNTNIMKWHNNDPGLKNLPPRAMTHVGPCVNTALVVTMYYSENVCIFTSIVDRSKSLIS